MYQKKMFSQMETEGGALRTRDAHQAADFRAGLGVLTWPNQDRP